MTISLAIANQMILAGRQLARQRALKPLTLCVLDESGHIVSAQREDGSTLLTFELAHAKAWGCLGMGRSTRYFKDVLVKERPEMTGALELASRGRFVAEYGGVLVRDAEGRLMGAVGVAGGGIDEDDEAIAIAAVGAGGLVADAD